MAKDFRFYLAGEGRYQIFRGKGDSDTWYVYDLEDKRYVGGNFKTMAAARAWVDAQ